MTTADFGPGPFAVTPASPFFLSGPSWDALNAYVQAGLQMPAPIVLSMVSQVNNVLALAESVYTHCHTWQHTYYPEMLGLASDIASWASAIPSRYGNLQTIISQLVQSPSSASIAALTQATGDLAAAASGYAGNAQQALTDIQTFISGCEQDQQAYQNYQANGTVWYITDTKPYLLAMLLTAPNVPTVLAAMPSFSGPLQTLQLLQGFWTAIVQDFNNLATQASASNPGSSTFLATLDLNSATTEWTAVGNAASAFLASVQPAVKAAGA